MSIWDRDQCQTYWGSHGCKLARGHDGEHQCQDLDEDQPHDRINRDGIDPETGFRWDLYGDDASPLVQ